MNTALIIICIVFCAGIVLWALAHFGTAIRLDKIHRDRGRRSYASRAGQGQTRNPQAPTSRGS